MIISKNQSTSSCHDASEDHPQGELAWILDWNFHKRFPSHCASSKSLEEVRTLALTPELEHSIYSILCMYLYYPSTDFCHHHDDDDGMYIWKTNTMAMFGTNVSCFICTIRFSAKINKWTRFIS